MEFNYKGKAINFDYESLTPEIDEAFNDFFLSSLKSGLDISLINKESLPQLERVSLDHIKDHSDFETTRKYFKNLRFIWSVFVNIEGEFQNAEWYLERILRPIQRLEQQIGQQIHKGPIYYFWGGTALLMGEIDKGFLLMHSAYEEEIRIQEPQPTPSYKFISLNYADEKQFFGFLVKDYAEYLSSRFNPYRQAKVTHYDPEEFRKNFLELNPNPDIAFSFTHTLARLKQLSHFDKNYLYSDFAGQYKLNLLFDLALVIENGLRVKHPDYGKTLLFPILAQYLSEAVSWNLRDNDLKQVVQQELRNIGFDETITKLLQRTFPFQHNISNLELESDLAIVYLIRNRGAHDVTSSKIVTYRFEEVLQSMFNILFLATQTIYA